MLIKVLFYSLKIIISVIIIGDSNVGKTSFKNCILGEEFKEK